MEINNDLDGFGFSTSRQKRGLLIWILVGSITLNLSLVWVIVKKGEKAEIKTDKVQDRYDNIMEMLIKDKIQSIKAVDTLKEKL